MTMLTDWYWTVGNKSGVVYSSAAGDYVATDDANYQQWITNGGTAFTVQTDGEMADVLTNWGASFASPTAVRNAGWTAWGNVPLENQYNVILKAGVTVQSTATSALDGIYAMDPTTRTRQNSNMVYIQQNDAFSPNKAATKDWPDVSGALHTFTSITDFQNWYTATGDWFSALTDWYANGGTGALPTEPVTIP